MSNKRLLYLILLLLTILLFICSYGAFLFRNNSLLINGFINQTGTDTLSGHCNLSKKEINDITSQLNIIISFLKYKYPNEMLKTSIKQSIINSKKFLDFTTMNDVSLYYKMIFIENFTCVQNDLLIKILKEDFQVNLTIDGEILNKWSMEYMHILKKKIRRLSEESALYKMINDVDLNNLDKDKLDSDNTYYGAWGYSKELSIEDLLHFYRIDLAKSSEHLSCNQNFNL